MVSHAQVIKNYFEAVDREHYNRGCNVYFKNNTLYSYGSHFILAQKCKNGYILNGDRYSVSTSKHQSITRSYAPSNSPIIPFSALQNIFKYGLDEQFLQEIKIIDITKDTWEEYTYKDKDGKEKIGQKHHLGASLIEYNKKLYLSSIDPSSKNYAYFLVELPKTKEIIQSVNQAYRLLAGNLTDFDYNERYLKTGEIKRQGEYFLVPTPLTTKQLKNLEAIIPRKIIKNVDLSNGVGNSHIATECIKLPKKQLFIRKTLRHAEHKMISLKNTWHKVVKNTAKNSWSASGNVD